MQNNKQLTVAIVSGVIILLIGVCIGFTFARPSKEAVTKTQAANSLSSQVISSITAYGQVASISGTSVELSSHGDTLTVSLPSTARIYSFGLSSTGTSTKKSSAPTQQTASFSDIKVGDSVNVSLKLLPNGQFEGSSLVILPISQNS